MSTVPTPAAGVKPRPDVVRYKLWAHGGIEKNPGGRMAAGIALTTPEGDLVHAAGFIAPADDMNDANRAHFAAMYAAAAWLTDQRTKALDAGTAAGRLEVELCSNLLILVRWLTGEGRVSSHRLTGTAERLGELLASWPSMGVVVTGVSWERDNVAARTTAQMWEGA